jgi:hypothetical protein
MTFEEALAQTMSIAGLLDLGGRRILDADGFQALLGNAQRQRPTASPSDHEQGNT